MLLIPSAIAELKKENFLNKEAQYRSNKYLNNRIEQDHRFIKRRVKPSLGFFSYPTAWRTLQGYEALNIVRKGQVKGAGKQQIADQNRFISKLFGLAA